MKTRAQTVLVVEDDVLVRLSIADYLRDCGFKVLEAVNGEEAVVVLQSDLVIDAILSGVRMPGAIDGFGLSKWVRSHKPGVPMILVGSANGAAEAAAELCEAGPMLKKPYEPQAVVDRIKRLLAEQKRV